MMMKSTSSRPKRTGQVGGLIQKEISDLLLRKIKDPRLEMVTITGVEVTPDLKLARVFFSRLGNPEEVRETLQGLKKASGFHPAGIGRPDALAVCAGGGISFTTLPLNTAIGSKPCCGTSKKMRKNRPRPCV